MSKSHPRPDPDRAGPEPGATPDRPADEAADPAGWLHLHGDALYRFARTRVGRRETAEDLVQETLLAALQASDRFRGDSPRRTWLTAILRRKIADFYRRERASAPTIEADLTAPPGRSSSPFDAEGNWRNAPSNWRGPQAALDDADFWRVFEACAARLPRHLAEAFLLREVEGLDVEALRAALDVGAGNLRVRLHRARLLLRECLAKNWFGTDPPRSAGRP
ncbi:sigma-70 family RNA polymerase sigma factor [Paludisphaera mucosa]|uniref:RNA polymerase sigma factor n=1 Tax=Paludisphaera mucosa TaxID=3030827 RepID=A0ABT6FBY0_9BACT|nr:sigma-70 family RNA polymerase sigma factor [Paludisphaera mucosa]MDG3005057.1 sigma-70 family RNA polymerase sigma factor [Paludisphaera mucosa]